MIPLENAQRQMLEQIKEWNVTHPHQRLQIEGEDEENILDFLVQLHCVEDKDGYWKLTEHGYRILEHDQEEIYWKKRREKREFINTIVSSLSMGFGFASLIFTALTFLLK